MSGFVPKRVSQARTAMGSIDANSTGKNGHSIVSTIGRRSTLLRGIQTRSFGSMWQIDYLNAAGNKCKQEELVPTFSTDPVQLTVAVPVPLTVFRDGNTAGFVRKSLQNSLVSLYGGSVYTDKYCAMGNIGLNVGDNIRIPTNLQASGSACPFAGAPIVAIERWLTGGWTTFATFGAADKNGLVLVLGGTFNSALTIANAPSIRLSGVRGSTSTAGERLDPVSIAYCNSTGTITDFGGVNIGDFVVILYGGGIGGGGGLGSRVDGDFIGGLAAGGSKNFQFQFVNS